MDKVAVLCRKDSEVLHEFSKRSLQRVTGRALSRFQLPFISTYMESNVMKEVDKDRIIINAAAALFRSGGQVDTLAVDAVFEDTKAVDKAFVRKLLVPSLSVTVRYEDFADIRKGRIRCLSRAVHGLLAAWDEAASFEDAVRKAYTAQQFKDVLTEILHLYNLETKMVGKSTKFFHPFNTALNLFSDTLFDSMEETSVVLVGEYARTLFGDEAHAKT